MIEYVNYKKENIWNDNLSLYWATFSSNELIHNYELLYARSKVCVCVCCWGGGWGRWGVLVIQMWSPIFVRCVKHTNRQNILSTNCLVWSFHYVDQVCIKSRKSDKCRCFTNFNQVFLDLESISFKLKTFDSNILMTNIYPIVWFLTCLIYTIE